MKILIIDDDTNLSSGLKSNLEPEGFVVDIANSGSEGVNMIKINEYDLVILDLNLPDKNGNTVCEEIRSSGLSIPILILSAQSQIDYKVELLNNGADCYLTKPFSFNELLARVRALLRRREITTPTILYSGELKIDVNNQTVHRGNKSIYLTRKEFVLLKYLMINKGNVVSRSAILEHVWDSSVDAFSKTIETHILNIRKKIGKTSNLDFIVTVPGRGYIVN